MIIITLIMKKAYKLVRYGDPILTQISKAVAFPLCDEVDETIDDCIHTLVFSLVSDSRRGLLRGSGTRSQFL